MRIKLDEIWSDEEISAKMNGEQFVLPVDILKAIFKDCMQLGFLDRTLRFRFEMYTVSPDGYKFYRFGVTQAKGSNRFKIVKKLLSYFKSLGFTESDSYYNEVLFPKSELENLVVMYKMKNLL